ncbi:MAG: rod shape-determining protein MreC [Nitrospiraceae bacterium]
MLLLLLALLFFVVFLLPRQARALLQTVGQPVAWVVSFPLKGFAAIDRSVMAVWERYLTLRGVEEENRRLRREIQYLQGQNNQLQALAADTRRLAALLEFKERTTVQTLAARVVGRDSTNWYRAMVLDKGELDGVRAEMGVVTPVGVVGRVVKATRSTSVVLLVSDPNNAVTGLIQRTREEGIVEGTAEGRARLKYIPLLSTVRAGDTVITSGLTGGFPKGIMIGVVARIEKEEGALFQSAEIVPEVDLSKVEEALIITSSNPVPQSGADGAAAPVEPSNRGAR